MSIETIEEKTLPVFFPPPTQMFGHLMIPLSILLAHKDTSDWLYSNYIQLCAIPNFWKYRDDEDIELINFYPIFFYEHKSVFLTVYNLHDGIINIEKKEFINHMIKWIKNGYYIQIYLNLSEITGTYWYKKQEFNILGEALFFGYDLKNKIFKFLSFDTIKEYRILEMTFDDLMKAFFSPVTRTLVKNCDWPVVGEEYGILLYRFNDKAKYSIDINSIIRQMEEYIYSKNSSHRFEIIDNEEIDHVYGLDIYKVLLSWLSLYNSEGIDIRPICGLWDHKKIMKDRISYLVEKGYLDESKNQLGKYSKVEEIANKIRLLLFKYNLTRNNSILKKMIFLLKELPDMEFDILYDVISDLKKYDISQSRVNNKKR